MSEVIKTPTNLSIVKVDSSNVRNIGEVKTGQIFDTTNAFHPEGLFSAQIFGPVGSEGRNRTFGRINLNIDIMHPLIYQTVITLKAFYKKIIDGTATAIFDTKLKDFVPSNEPKADTGYAFFIKHMPDIVFIRNNSEHRDFKIRLFEKTLKEGSALINYLLVMPAGMRDYVVDSTGKPQEDEINTFYRRIIAQATIIDPTRAKRTPDVYNAAAVGLQRSIDDLYEYVKSLMDGKNKLILDKWVGRKIFNSTRNVISSPIDKSNSLDDKRKMGFNEVVVGLHQFARSSSPKSLFEIKNKYIRDIFPDNSTSGFLTNVKTLKREEVLNTHIQKDYDLWTSPEGLEKVVASLGNLDIRNSSITLNKGKHYMGLLYRDRKVFKFFQDIDELPEGFSKDNVKPVTLFEFIYMSLYSMDGKYPGFATRYPITGFGSIYPAKIRLSTSADTDTLYELNSIWEKHTDEEYCAVSFPIDSSEHINTMIVHESHLKALGGDYDGDALSLTMVLSDEAVKEVDDYLDKKDYYVTDTGSFIFSSSTDTMDAVLKYIT